ncbi:hypothetical protein G8E10_17585 [Rhizobiaceae bacterium CRRU44]|uniref:Uncharacterized protein n=1 Tax=Ferranicluibacter rubi TaxID=2715133 RepID=A0AA43ZGM5_9HYPH|nr:hypothetical protein [Ferranicluibacter rubi]NHT77529.1 hypothetical protein [Ferranicluibacter rubi]
MVEHILDADYSTQLLETVLKHFPAIGRKRAEDLAESADYDIRQCIARLGSRDLRRRRGAVVVENVHTARSPAANLKRRLEAVRSRSQWRYLKARAESTDVIEDFRRDAIEQLGVFEQACNLSHLTMLAAAVFDGQDGWALEERILERAKESAALGRRQRHSWEDDALVEIVCLWSSCSGRRPPMIGPGRKTPIDRKGEMTAFVQDALACYAGRGVDHIFPGASTNSWRRVVLKYREQFL